MIQLRTALSEKTVFWLLSHLFWGNYIETYLGIQR